MLRTPSRLLAPVIVLAFAGWGCGSSVDAPTADTAAPPKAKSGGPMKVAAVDGRVGDATTATSDGGIKRLKVRRKPTDPRVRQGVGAGASCADVDIMPAADNLAAVTAATMCLVNGERADAGLPPLSGNAKLDQSSIAHSQDMVAKSYFDHRGPDGRDVTDRVRLTGYIPQNAGWTVGENLAWGTGTLATPRAIVQAWMNSQGHRENILRSAFKEAGQGIVLGNPRAADGEGATYTMNFGAIESDVAGTLASTVRQVADQAPRITDAARRAAARRAAARRRKACRTRASKARTARVRKARAKRCMRAARRSARR